MELNDIQDTKAGMGPFESQDAEEMPLPYMTSNVMEGTEAISTQECMVWEAWCGWWESLKTAHRMQQVTAAALQDDSRGEPTTCEEAEAGGSGKFQDMEDLFPRGGG